jgi:hypothetical protein
LAANAAIVFGKRLWHDSRIAIFEQAVDTSDGRRRVSFGEAYAPADFLSLFDDKVRDFTPLLPVELAEYPERVPHVRLHNGTLWSWNRPLIGFEEDGRPHVRIEHRVMSAGPTTMDMFANIALSLGLAYGLANLVDRSSGGGSIAPEDQCLFSEARQNFYAAARHGLTAQVSWLGKRSSLQALLLDQWLPLARQGLQAMQVDDRLIVAALEVLEQRTRSGRTAAAWQMEAFDRHRGNCAAILEEYLTHQATGQPVHSW